SLFGRCIYFSNDTTGFIGNYLGIFKTTDGGITWNAEVVPSIPSAEFCTFTASTAVSYYALCDTITNGNGAIYGNFPASSCTVFTGPDTTFCQTQGQLLATPGTPGSNYVFSWSPATGLSDPNAQNPYVNYVSNQQYVVTMTDTVTLCSATDTIVVSAFNLINSPQYFCGPDSVLLDFGPGATLYDWQFFTDTAGNVTTINQNTQTYWATTQGYYTGYATFPGCGSLTSNVQAIDTCALFVWALNVWPGDCNYDLIANVADALYIGLGYGTTGATRPGANNSWTAQPMNDWTQNFTTSNYKHADCDGNGIIDANDTLAIFQNYGQTHPYRLSAPQELPASTPTLELVANYDTVGYQTLVTIDIRLGNSTVPVDSIYGISFRLRTDFNLIDTTLTVVNLNNTWLGTPGTDMFHFRKSFPSAGVVDIAECGTDHQNRLNGQGSIGSLLIVTTDNVSGISVCHFEASDITAVTISEAFLTVAAVNDSVVIDPTFLTSVPSENAGGFSMYPNPGTTQVTIRTNNAAQLIEICDMTGRIISTTNVTGYTTTIDLEDFASSVYFVRVTNGNFVSTQKLTIAN
ncbi:MAG TPA: T9SS type A sorting domain-containing protein, partial [Bacteroidia bacterium]|nr:T9SS type A sorting domain-containing protein [Bacteroidia bacterium]